MWHGPELPLDQRPDDAGSLVFDTDPLPEAIDLIGAPVLELELAVDRPAAFVVARLCDVAPDGASARDSWMPFNLTHDPTHQQADPVEPGRRMRVSFALDDLAHRFPAGHRIRLALSTAYWPLVWPSPEPVTLTLTTGGCSLTLPVAPTSLAAGWPLGEPAGSRPAPMTVLREPHSTRTVTVDDGVTVFEILDDFGSTVGAHGLGTSSVARETYRIVERDPLSARVDTEWTEEMWRGDGWSIRSVTTTSMTADRSSFRLQGSLRAFEGDAEVLARSWDETIPRLGC
jgi:hypothetical protein